MPKYEEQACEDISAGPLLSAREGLAVYNRQYWFRLFTLLQNEFRLTGRLLGLWHFNELASRFLLQHPPRHYDLHHAASGFEAFLARELPETVAVGGDLGVVPREALLEAARIDAAFRQVFMAPAEPRFQPSTADAARLAQARLKPALAFALVEEHWPLFRLRHELVKDAGERAVKLPAPYVGGARWWALVRAEQGQLLLPLAPLQARLLQLLLAHSVSEALGILESKCSPMELESLAQDTQTWLAESVQHGFWSGLVEHAPERQAPEGGNP
jgi:hypothetical protein